MKSKMIQYRVHLVVLSSVVCIGCDDGIQPRQSAVNHELSNSSREAVRGDATPQAGVQKIDWNLADDNSIQLVGWPKGNVSTEYVLDEDLDLSIEFPAKIIVRKLATRVICKRQSAESNRVDSIEIHLPNCTRSEAYEEVKGNIERWGLMTDSVDAIRSLKTWRSDGDGRFLAVRHNNYPVIDVQIQRSSDVSHPWFVSIYVSIKQQPLPENVVSCFDALRIGDEQAFQRLLEGGVDANSVDVLNETLLQVAAGLGRVKFAQTLIERGAEVNAVGDYGQTPLALALIGGKLKVAELLLKHGADPNFEVKDRGAVIHIVCENQMNGAFDGKAIRWLIDHGADIDKVNHRGETPLHKAVLFESPAAAVLLAAGANVNAKNEEGATPLDYAINRRNRDLQELLKRFGGRKGGSE